jgi:hypothetical protein
MRETRALRVSPGRPNKRSTSCHTGDGTLTESLVTPGTPKVYCASRAVRLRGVSHPTQPTPAQPENGRMSRPGRDAPGAQSSRVARASSLPKPSRGQITRKHRVPHEAGVQHGPKHDQLEQHGATNPQVLVMCSLEARLQRAATWLAEEVPIRIGGPRRQLIRFLGCGPGCRRRPGPARPDRPGPCG